jgi:alpha-tubulin suppressor-like RCC1 family protein
VTIAKIDSNGAHTCVLFSDGSVDCWGSDVNSQLSVPLGVTFSDISAGSSFTCGIQADEPRVGAAFCWGKDLLGTFQVDRTLRLKAIDAGGQHICGIQMDDTIVCWGNNDHRQTEAPLVQTFVDVSAGGDFSCGLKADGTVQCWGANNYQQSTVPEGELFVAIDSGDRHTCGLQELGTIVCWEVFWQRRPISKDSLLWGRVPSLRAVSRPIALLPVGVEARRETWNHPTGGGLKSSAAATSMPAP